MKKCISLLIAIILLVTVFPFPSYAEETETEITEDEETSSPTVADAVTYCGDSLTWRLESGTLVISGSGDMYDYEGETEVPWYDIREDICRISLDPEITGIGDYAFFCCGSISSAVIPDGVGRIGISAFSGNTRILAMLGSASEAYALQNGNPFSALVAVPVISALSNVTEGVSLKWDAVDDALIYRVFRKTAVSGWMILADTEYCSYTDGSVESGNEYTYSVQCYSEDGLEPTSSFDEAGASITFLSAPVIRSISATNGGIYITWNKVPGAWKYRVCRKAEGETWIPLGETSGNSYADDASAIQTAYRYTVCCIDPSGQAASGYDPDGRPFTMTATPEISAVTGTVDGVRISWGRIDGATEYRVYRKSGNGSWSRIGHTSSCSYTDTAVESGTTYSYTVRCLDSAGVLISAYSPDGKSITYVAAPHITSITADYAGVYIAWGKVNGAAMYRVFRKTGGGSWTRIGETSSVSFTDKTAVEGTAYTYTVRCADASGNYISSYDPAGESFMLTAAPSLSGISNVNGGVRISWEEVPGAESYRVYRKTSGGGWARIGETSSAVYADSTAASGTEYSYTVRCLDSWGNLSSVYDPAGRTIRYLAAPAIGSITNTVAGTRISWGRIAGAVKYRVYRKSAGGSWSALGDTEAASFTDTAAEDGMTYRYTVRAIDSSGTFSSYDAEGSTINYVAAPVITKVSAANGGVRITWTRSSSAVSCRIYRRSPGGTWARIGETAENTFLDTAAESGTVCIYTVRCLDSAGRLISDYDPAGKEIVYVAAPSIADIRSAVSGTRLSWGKIPGAAKYRVYRKNDAGSWSFTGETAAVTYTDTSVESGKTYRYTVRAVDSSGNYSAYDAGGWTVTFVAAPVLKSISAANGGIRFLWDPVPGAASYRVYRKTDGGSWSRIGETTAASYTDRTAETETGYTYTVRCLDSSGSLISDYYPSGIKLSLAEVPVLSGISNMAGGVKISWDSSAGAETYRVFRRNASGSWTRIGDTAKTFFTDTSAESGKAYTYTVRCVDSSGFYNSDYDRTGVSITYVAAPVIKSLSVANGTVRITWDRVNGAEKYRVFRKNVNGSWTRIGDTASDSFLDSTAVLGATYMYTVRCMDNDGKYTSSYYSSKAFTVYSKKIYLSPSNQDANTFITGNANEGDVWNDIAVRLAALLADYDCDVRIADFDMVLDDRAEEANQWGADVYIAMHSNAYVTPNTCRGIEVYYDANKENSDEREALATAFLNELSVLFVNRGLRTASYLKECRLPEMPSVIVECGYHDTVSDANLILGNKDRIAQLYCSALVGYLGLTKLSEYNH